MGMPWEIANTKGYHWRFYMNMVLWFQNSFQPQRSNLRILVLRLNCGNCGSICARILTTRPTINQGIWGYPISLGLTPLVALEQPKPTENRDFLGHQYWCTVKLMVKALQDHNLAYFIIGYRTDLSTKSVWSIPADRPLFLIHMSFDTAKMHLRHGQRIHSILTLVDGHQYIDLVS